MLYFYVPLTRLLWGLPVKSSKIFLVIYGLEKEFPDMQGNGRACKEIREKSIIALQGLTHTACQASRLRRVLCLLCQIRGSVGKVPNDLKILYHKDLRFGTSDFATLPHA